MSLILNDRDVLIQSLTRNIAPSQGRAFVLGADTPVFTVDAGGLGSPSLIRLTTQLINIVGTVSWSVTGASGVTVSGDSLSATLAFSDVTASTISVQAQVTYLGVTYMATQVLQKVTQGIQGNSTAQVYAYKRAVSAPVDNPGAVTWTFASATITTPSTDALANGWTKTIPGGTDPLYVTLASALGAGTTDTIAAGEWATPVKLAQDGLNGLNSATVFIYQRAASTPALPSVTATYTFNTGVVTGLNNGWSYQTPAGSNPLYVSQATAASNTTTDTILSSEWAAAQILVQNGTNGSPGNPGGPGARGTVNLAQAGFSGWSDAGANSLISSSGYGSPVQGDIVTLYNASFSQTRFYSGSWLVLSAYINGNMLVSGTLSASVISGGILNGVIVRFGSGHTPSGNAFEIVSTGVVWVDNLFVGIGVFNNNNITSSSALQANSYGNNEAFIGNVVSSNAGAGAHGVRGRNQNRGTSGLVGAQNNFDFYADGSGTNYGPFTGAHDVLVANGVTVAEGDLVVDMCCIARRGWSNTLFEVALSSAPMQPTVLGMLASLQGPLNVLRPAAMIQPYRGVDPSDNPTYNTPMGAEWDAHKDAYQVWAANAVGEGQMNVCGEGGNIAAGDFIVTSTIPGKGMRQADDLVRNYTVARARESVSFSAPTEVKQIACIYLCG